MVHTIEASQRLFNDDPSPEELALWRQRPSKEHPLVWTHQSGRRSLVLGATADHMVGMDCDEGRALLDDLLARSTTPERIYRHDWSVGDMVIWDNRGVLHRAGRYDPTSPRDMHRTTLPARRPSSDPRPAWPSSPVGPRGSDWPSAERLSADGNAVAIFDRDGEAADAAAAGIVADGGSAVGLTVDVTDRDQIDQGVVDAARHLGGGPPCWSTAPDWTASTRSSRSPPRSGTASSPSTSPAPSTAARPSCPEMIEEAWGRIVNISSSSAHGGQPHDDPLRGAKAGVMGFTKALALELGPKGITVNTIPPGFIDTPMLRKSEARGLLGEGVEHHAALTPVRRVGTAEDIAAACAFLVSDEASYITGQVIGVNGGRNT